MTFVEEVEGLGKSEEEDDENDAEGEHVSRDHTVHHRHERTRQFYSTGQEKETHGVFCHGFFSHGLFNLAGVNVWRLYFMDSYPAKNIIKNHAPTMAKLKSFSSVFKSPIIRNGIQASIRKFANKKMAFGGAWG